MIDISMQYLGLKLSSPIVVASTPLSESIDNVRHMEDAGASAIVLTSLFEEQLALESRALDEDLSRGTDSFAESLGFLPELGDYRMTQQLSHNLRRAREAVSIPIMASLNGATKGGWVRFAKERKQAGAHAIELNTYALATDCEPDLNRSRTAVAPPGLERSARRSRFRLLSSSHSPSPAFPTSSPVFMPRVLPASCSSTASISPTSTSRPLRCAPRCTSPRPPSFCRVFTGRPFFTARSTWTSASPAAFIPLRMF